MPTTLPEPLAGTRRAVRLLLVLVVVLDAGTFAVGWFVAHATASVGWGVLAGATAFLVGVLAVIMIVWRLQARALAIHPQSDL
jgi:hypothetical protein